MLLYNTTQNCSLQLTDMNTACLFTTRGGDINYLHVCNTMGDLYFLTAPISYDSN